MPVPPHPDHPNLIVFDHPLIAHKISQIRDQQTTHRPFRALVTQVAGLMVYEVTRTFASEPVDIQTPMALAPCRRISSVITVVPVLRAGLGMTHGVLELMPEARVGHLGLVRDESTLEPRVYLKRLPSDIDAGPVILIDPMLATGGSAAAAIRILRDAGASDLRMICLVAAPEGVRRLAQADPAITIYTAALDEKLNDQGYIIPGLGDAGDRLFGTL